MGVMIGLNEGFSGPTPPPQREQPGEMLQLPRLVERLFSRTGPLVKELGLEHRPEQSQMALAVAQSIVANQPLLFEAGTGVGKSLAYLLPSLVFAQMAERTCVVSSHTIALQEQIMHQDLELCRRLFKQLPALHPYADFKVSLLLGRGNYLCGTRLARAIETKVELFPTEQMKELERISDWANTTEMGLLQELNPTPSSEVWEWVNADSHACNKRNCSPDTCFYRRALEKVRKSHLVIVNHALLFALIGAGAQPGGERRGVLFPDDFTVLDEAHRVPAVAAEHFGIRLSSYGFDRLMGRLYSTKGSGKKAHGLLALMGNDALRASVRRCRTAGTNFFAQIDLDQLSKQDIVRCHRTGWADNNLLEPLSELLKGLGDLYNRLEDGPMRDEIKGARSQVNATLASLKECLELADESSVYWIERTGKRKATIALRSAPIDVAPLLRDHLFRRQTSVTLTSATLAEGSSMASFQGKVGADGVYGEQVYSPFDYNRNAAIYIASDAPAPSRANARLDVDYLADMIAYCSLKFRGGTLVLFTSYRDLRAVAEIIQPQLERAGRLCLQQGRDGSRQFLARQMKEAGNAVLFGTESFWTGIDVPGPALSQVIITRLPFDNPSHPIAQAKSEYCLARGGQPFQELTLPEAVIKFRQGIGRLIRRKTDRGTLTLLDSRVLDRPYGREFLSVLPKKDFKRFDRTNRDQVFAALEA